MEGAGCPKRGSVITFLAGVGLLSAAIWAAVWSSPAVTSDEADTGFADVVHATYGITLDAEQATELQGEASITTLQAPPERELVMYGETVIVHDAAGVRLTLAGVNDEWVLLENDPSTLTEFASN